MKTKRISWWGRVAFLGLISLLLESSAPAADNIWTNINNGYWESAGNWTGGYPTNTFDRHYITNAYTKTVTLLSPLLLPPTNGGVGSLTISNLTISAPLGYVNTLAISTLSEGPFRILNDLTIGSGGMLAASGVATTRVEGVSGGYFTINGSAQLSTGLLLVATNVTTQVANSFGSTGTLTIQGGLMQAGTLNVAGSSDATGTVWLTGGQLVTAYMANIGLFGAGRMTVSNATWLAQSVYVGNGGGPGGYSTGTLTVGGGGIVDARYLGVGSVSGVVGTVWLTGGQLIVTNIATSIGISGTGRMTVSNGSWLADTVYVGYSPGSQGTLTIAGGTNVVGGYLDVGLYSGASGSVLLDGGELNNTNSSSATSVGESGVGQMTVNGGLWRAAGVNVGNGSGSSGALTINGGTNLIGTWLRLGVFANAQGSLSLANGLLVTTNAETDIGRSGIGEVNVSGGTWLGGEMYVGYYSGSRGALTINGGTVTLNSALIVGYDNVATGSVTMFGGLLNVTNSATHVGQYGAGEFYLYGGTFRSSSLKIGQGVGGSGVMSLLGGTLEMVGPLTIGETNRAGGRLSVYSGQIIATNPNASINIGTGGDAYMYLGGGTVRARNVRVGDGTAPGTLYLAGGTLTGGSLVITPSGLLQLGGGNLASIVTNQGVIQFYTGNFTFAGGLDNLGNFNLPANQIVTVKGGLGNEGGAIVAGDSSVLNADSFRNARHNGILFLNSAAQLNVTASWTNQGALELSQGTVAGGTVHNASYIEGVGAVMAPVVNNAGGTIRANGGLLALVGSSVANQSGAYLEASDGGTLRIGRSLLNQGFINPQGGLVDFGSNMLTNQGTLTGFGTYKASLIINQNRATFNGGNLNIQAAYLNSAGATTILLHVTANFFGSFTNASGAYFKNTGSDVTFFGPTSIGGTYLSDPAMNTFNGDVTLDPTGVLVGGAGDVFVIGGDLSSANPQGLQLAGAKVVFNEGAHTFTLSGTAQIGELEVSSGGMVNLIGGDLVVGVFGAETNEITTAQTIYYDPMQNPDLAGQTYTLEGGGTLTAIPEPGSALLVVLGVALLFRCVGRSKST